MKSIYSFNGYEYMNDRSHLKRFKDAKKELRGHKVTLIFLQYLEHIGIIKVIRMGYKGW